MTAACDVVPDILQMAALRNKRYCDLKAKPELVKEDDLLFRL